MSIWPNAPKIAGRATSGKNLSRGLTASEMRHIVGRVDCARKHGRYGHRDATMILVAYRHGLRASEVCDLQWQQIELFRFKDFWRG